MNCGLERRIEEGADVLDFDRVYNMEAGVYFLNRRGVRSI
jgi:hypothetical protein